jgi:hypothetical protein
MNNTMCIPGGHWKERPRAGLLGQGFHAPVPDEDGPTITDATTPVPDEVGGTYKILSK